MMRFRLFANTRTPSTDRELAERTAAPYAPPMPDSPSRPVFFEQPWLYGLGHSPKRAPGKLLDVWSLRQLADHYDVLRACIETLKAEVVSTQLRFVSRHADEDASISSKIHFVESWISEHGPLGSVGRPRRHFESELIEDLLVVGAGAIWYSYDEEGNLSGCSTIDASTICPRITSDGWIDGQYPYEQQIQGTTTARFRPQELRYDGLYPRTHSPYFTSPIEWLTTTVQSALRADQWNRTWLTEGNVSTGDVITLPADWSPEQVLNFAHYWDSMLTGQTGERQKTRFLPSGSTKLSDHTRKDQDFQEFELWLMRRTCSIMGVQPASIGFAGEQYKVSQEGSFRQSRRIGVGKLLEFRKAFYDDLLVKLGLPELEALNVSDVEEDASARTSRLVSACGGAYLTINEVRALEGRPSIPGGDVLASQFARCQAIAGSADDTETA